MPEVFIGEGFNFNIAAFQKSTKTVAGSLKTYYYRRDNPTSAMTKFSIQKCECGLLALEIIKEKLQIHTERIERAWEFANWRTHSDFYDAFILAKAKNEYPDRAQEDERMEQIQRLRTEKNQVFQPVKKDTDNLQAVIDYYNNRRYQHRLFIQTPMQAHVSAMNRAA